MGTLTAHPTAAASNNAVGNVAWSNPLNVVLPDDSKATCILLLGQQSEYLKSRGYQFGCPLDSQVVGIQFSPERSATLTSGVEDTQVRLLKADTPTGDNKAAAGQWPTSDTTQNYGGAADLWGTTWTPQEVNDPLFGAALSASALVGVTSAVDACPMTVTYLGSNRPALLKPRFKVGDGMGCSN